MFGPPGTGRATTSIIFFFSVLLFKHFRFDLLSYKLLIKSEIEFILFIFVCSGKTVTLVEAIKQIEKTQASYHILACAPSNSAADLLCRKILEHVDEHKVFRLYARSRDPKAVPDRLKVSGRWIYIPSDYK